MRFFAITCLLVLSIPLPMLIYVSIPENVEPAINVFKYIQLALLPPLMIYVPGFFLCSKRKKNFN